MKYKALASACYLGVAIALYGFLEQVQPTYFAPIARPILDNWLLYSYALNLWFLIILTDALVRWFLPEKLSGMWMDYIVTPINAMLLSCGYFWLVMRAYVGSFSQISIEIAPIVGICVLMALARSPVGQIAKLNLVVLCVVAPLALQYALIAVQHGTPLK